MIQDGLEEQIEKHFGLKDVICKDLNMPTNDAISITSPTGHFLLKIYSVREVNEVQWEIDLINHLVKNGAPVVRPVQGKNGYVELLHIDGDHPAVLFEWVSGGKPEMNNDTYYLLGKAAAQIHKAADTFASSLSREIYNENTLIDEQLTRMKPLLIEAGKWEQVFDLGKSLKNIISNSLLNWGICHMDLTVDNVHLDGNEITVFDFDSSGMCWRAIESHTVLRISKVFFEAWLNGYRSVRAFNKEDENAVGVFSIIGNLRVVAWNLGVATSSRGKPLLTVSDLPKVVDEWLEQESNLIH